MALKVFFSGEGPGYGTVAISGTELPPAGLEIAIQRNLDDKYLGQHQSWHTTPYWHSPARVESMQAGLQLKVGPEIVDGLVAASHMPLLLWARTGGIETQGVLRFKGQPLGSHAASEDTVELKLAEPPVQETDDSPEEDKTHLQEREHLREEAERKEAQRQQDERRLLAAEAQLRKQRRARRLRLLALMLFILLMIAAAVLAWRLGWFDRFLPTSNEPSKPATSQSNDSPPAKLPQPPQPAIQGRQFVQSYLQRDPKPTPQEMVASAKERETEQDCEAAMILYNFAADADADQAMALAQRYDPDTFQAGPCVKSPAPDTASHWYENPAKAGNTLAQRQLGKILTSRHGSGPVYEQGMRWLKQAAKAGDEEAKKLLAP